MRVTPMFAANAELIFGAGAPATFGGDGDEFTDSPFYRSDMNGSCSKIPLRL